MGNLARGKMKVRADKGSFERGGGNFNRVPTANEYFQGQVRGSTDLGMDGPVSKRYHDPTCQSIQAKFAGTGRRGPGFRLLSKV
jgi:hypothetical protein